MEIFTAIWNHSQRPYGLFMISLIWISPDEEKRIGGEATKPKKTFLFILPLLITRGERHAIKKRLLLGGGWFNWNTLLIQDTVDCK